MSKAVITILGLIGGKDGHQKATYHFEGKTKEYYNTLPFLIAQYASTHKIIPVFTQEAKDSNEKVLEKSGDLKVIFDERYFIEDEKNFAEVFKLLNEALESFDEVIVDVSHGFRHLPILMTVDLIMQNFKNTEKIKHILFAKEIIQLKEYEIIDLKEYLDIANIAFILSTFEKNYTVANHIKSAKYKKLVNALNNFSNDIMALNLTNLFKNSSIVLIDELNDITDIAIESQAKELSLKIKQLTAYKNKKRFQTYFDLSKNLFDKNYMLLSLALLFESIRMYIKTAIKKEHQEIVKKVEKNFEEDLYKIGDFFKNLQYSINDKYKRDEKNRKKANLNPEEYQELKRSFDRLNIIALYKKIDKTRNNLAHANSDNTSFKDIEEEIEKLLNDYYEKCFKKNNINDLMAHFS